MKFPKLLLGLLAAAGFSAQSGSAATNMVSGYLYGTNNWTADNTYILNGFTYVMSNAVLNIEPGTVIQGVAGTSSGTSVVRDFGSLFVCAGGKINAIGLPTKPIVFTSDTDDVTDPSDLPFPSRALWGGIVLLGNATQNNSAAFTSASVYDIYEGLPDTAVTNTTVGSPFLGQVDYLHRFGGSNDADSSGVLRYVSIRHGGKKLSADKEINGLSLGAVGNGTVIEFVEAYCIADDGFEFFGGSVNTKYLISAFNDDDGFDTDQGWHGKNQFWFGIQEPAAKDSGSEQNGQPNSPDVIVGSPSPVSNYEVRNATLIGAGTGTTGNDALRIRRDNDCRWFNSVITDFGGVRVRIDDDGTSTPQIENNIFFGYRTGANEDHGGAYAPAALNPDVNPLINSISRAPDGLLDPRPSGASPVFSDVRDTVPDGFFTPVAYKGAFDSNDNWAYGWSALSAEGHFAPRTNVVTIPAGYLYGTNNWVATNVYVMNGFVYVMSNAVLNIEAGTVIKGVAGTSAGTSVVRDFGSLFVCAGGKINAAGTANSPIIFTADVDDVADPSDLPFPSRQLWGGIVLLGNATQNNSAAFTSASVYDIYEGLPDTAVTNTTVGSPFLGQVDYLHRFGGSNDADSSGVLRYVSIRHGGKKLSADKEINGLSLGAVGNGTVIEYVETYCIGDDGYEFFGGSVNTKYLVSAFNDDDGFDTDQGWHGKNQFWFGIQEPATKDSGSEQNGQPNSPDVIFGSPSPVSNYSVWNATLIGAGTGATGNDALRIRRDNDCKWLNSVITDFGGVRVRIDDDGTSTPQIENNIFFGYRTGANEDYGGAYAPAALNPDVDPQLGGISRTANGLLDPTVKSTSPVYSYARNTTEDGFLTKTSYVGAFGAENWAQDWTALGHGGFFKVTSVTSAKAPTVVPVTTGSNADGSLATVSFPSVVGTSYKVQSTADFTSWTDETSWVSGTGGTLSYNIAVPGVRKIFRVLPR